MAVRRPRSRDLPVPLVLLLCPVSWSRPPVQHVPVGLVTAVETGDVVLDDLYGADELMILAGDTHIFPIVSLDGRTIGQGTSKGQPGPVWRAIQAAVQRELQAGTGDNFVDVPYGE